MTTILDTHFLVWLLTDSPRLDSFPWLTRYQPWGISPVSILELQYLAEIGRIEIKNPEFTQTLSTDPRFLIDEVPLLSLVKRALDLSWTRDPFDRLLAAHSLARQTPLCTVDGHLRKHHCLLAPEVGRL